MDKYQDENIFDKYVDSLYAQIDFWKKRLGKQEIKTIYFGGGTPLLLGIPNILSIIEYLKKKFDLTYLEEISFELNPVPEQDVLNFIKTINNKYKNFFRIRYSIGIQTLDDDILELTGRDYYFNYIVGFLRTLYAYKESNNIFNFDFIAFGKGNWNNQRIDFFQRFLDSGFADSFSLYMLELFAGSVWYDTMKISQDDIYEEFNLLKEMIISSGYHRYEISNFALPGRSSIHNRVYWSMEDYLGLGLSASSFFRQNKNLAIQDLNDNLDAKAVRCKNTENWKKFLNNDFIPEVDFLSNKDYKIEEFFLGLRTDMGIKNLYEYEDILVQDYYQIIEKYKQEGLILLENQKLVLTDYGMDLYNQIIIELIKDF